MLMIIIICYAFTSYDLFTKQDYALAFMFLFYGLSCVCLMYKL